MRSQSTRVGLGAIFAAAIAAAEASAGVACGGAGAGSGTRAGASHGGAPPTTSADERGPKATVLAAPLPGFDWMAMRGAGDTSASFGGVPGAEGTIVHEVGVRCPRAPCSVELAHALGGFNQSNAIIWVKGGHAGSAHGGAELAALVGAIDTPEKAAIAAWLSGYTLDVAGFDGKPSACPTCASVTPGPGDTFDVLGAMNASRCEPPMGANGEPPKPEPTSWHAVVRVTRAGEVTEIRRTVMTSAVPEECHPLGRRPAGFRAARRIDEARTVDEWLACAAILEGASVPAFERLARDLGAHAAPRALVRRAERAAEDERRHAKAMASLASSASLAAAHCAQSGGIRVQHTYIPPDPGPCSLAELARENAVEGCVNETFAAIVAAWQARHARSAELRYAMRAIAADELAHAALAHDVAVWAQARLAIEDVAALAAVNPARSNAASALRDRLSRGPRLAESVRRAVGVPDVRASLALLDALTASTSAAAAA